MTLTIIAPTDPQLAYIADLCRKQGLEAPEAVASSQEASEIISAIRSGDYNPRRYDWLADGVPF